MLHFPQGSGCTRREADVEEQNVMLEALLAAGEVGQRIWQVLFFTLTPLRLKCFQVFSPSSAFRRSMTSYSKKLKDLYFFRKFVPRASNTCMPRALHRNLPASPTRLPCTASRGHQQTLSLDSEQKIRICEWWRGTNCSLLRAVTVLCGVHATKGLCLSRAPCSVSSDLYVEYGQRIGPGRLLTVGVNVVSRSS